MKGTGKTLISITLGSFLLLLFVHGQISLFQVSYMIDVKSEALAERSEAYRHLKFEVDQLKAPRILEARMKDLKMDLTLPKEVRVVRVPVVKPQQIQHAPVTEFELQPFSQGLLNFFGRWVKVAQAKTQP